MTINVDPVTYCVAFLNKERNYNREHNIWPSVNRVIDQVLLRTEEISPVYREAAASLSEDALKRFLTVIVEVPAIWNDEYIQTARNAYRRQRELRDRIHRLASELAGCLRERSDLSNRSGFSANDLVHIVDAIDRAAENNGHYTIYLQDRLKALDCQYDLKYWPNLADIVDSIGADALRSRIEPTDHITEAATKSSRPSLADSCRALLQGLEHAKDQTPHGLPLRFRLSDESTATIVNVTLNRAADELVDGAYIKRLRQRDRDAVAAVSRTSIVS